MAIQVIFWFSIGLLAVSSVMVVITSTDLYNMMPYFFNRNAWKVWKQCWNGTVTSVEEVEYKYEDSQMKHRYYHFAGGKYKAIALFQDGVYQDTSIFTYDLGKCVMSPFWKYHTNELYLRKLKDIPVVQ